MNQIIPATAIKIWKFEIYSHESTNKWIMIADDKKVFEAPMSDYDEAPEFLQEFLNQWNEGNIDF